MGFLLPELCGMHALAVCDFQERIIRRRYPHILRMQASEGSPRPSIVVRCSQPVRMFLAGLRERLTESLAQQSFLTRVF